MWRRRRRRNERDGRRRVHRCDRVDRRRPRRPTPPPTRPTRARGRRRCPTRRTSPTVSCRPGEHHVTEDEGDAGPGRHLVFGIEADTANPWAPYQTSYGDRRLHHADVGLRLAVHRDAESARSLPLLVESVEHNADYTEWTLHIRDGIKFHDGTPLDGAAVKFNIDVLPVLAADRRRRTRPIDVGRGVRPGRHHHDQRRPVGRPARRTSRRASAATCSRRSGWPAWRTSRSATPSSPVYDADAGGHAGRRRPGQAGRPRRVHVRVVHAGQRQLVQAPSATRTTGGARTASPVRTCPYLDAIEVVVAVDIDSRSNSLRSGQFDVMHTSNADTINQFLEDDGVRDDRRRAASATPATSC